MDAVKKEVFSKIQGWIQEEQGWRCDIKQLDENIMNVVIRPNESQNVNAYVHDNESDKITIVTRVSFTELDKKAYSRLSDDDKREFLLDLEILLLQINVIYLITPDPPQNIDSVELRKQIYFDGLTKDRFFESVLAILRGMQAMKLTYSSLSYRNR